MARDVTVVMRKKWDGVSLIFLFSSFVCHKPVCVYIYMRERLWLCVCTRVCQYKLTKVLKWIKPVKFAKKQMWKALFDSLSRRVTWPNQTALPCCENSFLISHEGDNWASYKIVGQVPRRRFVFFLSKCLDSILDFRKQRCPPLAAVQQDGDYGGGERLLVPTPLLTLTCFHLRVEL